MMRKLMALALMWPWWCMAQAAEESDELAYLSALVADEERLVDTARLYDLQQQALIKWDKDLAKRHAAARDRHLAEMKLQQMRKRVESVRQAWLLVLDQYPNNARANNYYGELLYDQKGDVAGAIRSWKLAATLDKQQSEPLNNLGLHYCHAGKYEMGIGYLESALKLEPNNWDYLFNMAQIYLVHFPELERRYGWSRKRIYKKAMKFSKKAAELAPDDYDLLLDYAVNFFAAENFDVDVDWRKAAGAWADARQYARGGHKRFFCWLNEARAWIRADDKVKAAQCLTEALRAYPDSDVARQLLETVRTDNG